MVAGGDNIFFHIHGAGNNADVLQGLTSGQHVTYTEGHNKKGKCAENIGLELLHREACVCVISRDACTSQSLLRPRLIEFMVADYDTFPLETEAGAGGGRGEGAFQATFGGRNTAFGGQGGSAHGGGGARFGGQGTGGSIFGGGSSEAPAPSFGSFGGGTFGGGGSAFGIAGGSACAGQGSALGTKGDRIGYQPVADFEGGLCAQPIIWT